MRDDRRGGGVGTGPVRRLVIPVAPRPGSPLQGAGTVGRVGLL